MANDGDTLRSTIRADIGDDDESGVERFDDNKLNTFIAAALKRLARRVALSITIDDGELSTEPTDVQFDLITLQTECIISKRDRYDGARKGARIRQDESEVDTSPGLASMDKAVEGTAGACTELEEAIAQYLETNPVDVTSVTGQYAENIWQGNKKLYEDVDHEGQGFERIYTPRKQAHQRRESSGGDGQVFDEDRFTTD